MLLTFLGAAYPLTKTFNHTPTGLESTPYPLTSKFTSYEVEAATMEDMYIAILDHAGRGNCLLKGNLTRPIDQESRAGLHAAKETLWMCADFDGFEAENVRQAMNMLGLYPREYVVQYSASHGIKKGINAHVFIPLDRPTSPEHLKVWTKWKNLAVPELESQLTLTKSNMALHWPLDVTVNQNDKLLYIAPAIVDGKQDDPGGRIELCRDPNGVDGVTIGEVPSTTDNDARAKVEALRAAKKLPKHNLKVHHYQKDQCSVLVNPDMAAVTGERQARGFTYLNLNGGDSWGYFFSDNDPEVLKNFKGEPNYRLREICPSYYEERKARQHEEKREAHNPKEECDKTQRFVINRADEGKYYKVTVDPTKPSLEMHPAPSLKHVADWCVIHHLPVPEIIDTWHVTFDPRNKDTIDRENKTLNFFSPTRYHRASRDATTAEWKLGIPDIYYRLLYHVCGSCDVATRRFINWLAYIWQTGCKPGTAWVLHGTYGTGKGRFLRILKELFGEHCIATTPESISEHFNAQIEKAQLLWIDEVTTEAWNNAKMTPKLRNWITEDLLSVRIMRRDTQQLPNFMGIIVAANEHNPVEIRDDDRRWNVAPRQESALKTQDWATPEVLDNERGTLYDPIHLQGLANALQTFEVNVEEVMTPMNNEAKAAVQATTQSLPEDIVSALLGGSTGYFLQFVPEQGAVMEMSGVDYRNVVTKMMGGGQVVLKNTEVKVLFEYLAGWNQSKGKFAKAAAKFGLKIANAKARVGDSTVAGSTYVFNVTADDRKFWAGLNEGKNIRLVKDEENTA